MLSGGSPPRSIVNRLPLAYKKRGRSPSRGGWGVVGGGGRRTTHTYMLTAFTTILASSLNQTSGTWRHCLLFRLACSSPLQAPRSSAMQCLEHTPAGRPPVETRVKLVSLSCLALAIER
jgi:hypothetical protein